MITMTYQWGSYSDAKQRTEPNFELVFLYFLKSTNYCPNHNGKCWLRDFRFRLRICFRVATSGHRWLLDWFWAAPWSASTCRIPDLGARRKHFDPHHKRPADSYLAPSQAQLLCLDAVKEWIINGIWMSVCLNTSTSSSYLVHLLLTSLNIATFSLLSDNANSFWSRL